MKSHKAHVDRIEEGVQLLRIALLSLNAYPLEDACISASTLACVLGGLGCPPSLIEELHAVVQKCLYECVDEPMKKKIKDKNFLDCIDKSLH